MENKTDKHPESMSDDAIRQFFHQQKHTVSDNDFTQRVMQHIPASQPSYDWIVYAIGLATSMTLLVWLDAARIITHCALAFSAWISRLIAQTSNTTTSHPSIVTLSSEQINSLAHAAICGAAIIVFIVAHKRYSTSD